jgi:hypothetical protein
MPEGPQKRFDRKRRSVQIHGPRVAQLVEMTTAHGRLDGLASAEAFVEAVVMVDGVFAVLPAEPYGLAVHVPVEVYESRARVLENRPHLLDLAPRRLVRIDALDELPFQVAYLWRVTLVDLDRVGRSAHELRELGEPSLDLRTTAHLCIHEDPQPRDERVDRLEREDGGRGRHAACFMMPVNVYGGKKATKIRVKK